MNFYKQKAIDRNILTNLTRMYQDLQQYEKYDELYLETGDDRFFQSSISICEQIEKIRKINKNFDELLIYIQELGGDISRSDLS